MITIQNPNEHDPLVRICLSQSASDQLDHFILAFDSELKRIRDLFGNVIGINVTINLRLEAKTCLVPNIVETLNQLQSPRSEFCHRSRGNFANTCHELSWPFYAVRSCDWPSVNLLNWYMLQGMHSNAR
jgi:hypothetical protein